jgi:hypothetical protein
MQFQNQIYNNDCRVKFLKILGKQRLNAANTTTYLPTQELTDLPVKQKSSQRKKCSQKDAKCKSAAMILILEA